MYIEKINKIIAKKVLENSDEYNHKVKEKILLDAENKDFAKRLLAHKQFDHILVITWENDVSVDDCVKDILMFIKDDYANVNKCIKDLLDWFLPEA